MRRGSDVKKIMSVLAAAVLALGTMTATASYAESQHQSARQYNRSIQARKVSTGAAPLAYQLFCLKNRNECKGGGAGQVRLSAQLMNKLVSVNQSVNASMRFTSDRKEAWTVGASRGDCEDFALTKRSRLIRLGVPAGALRIAVARNSKGEGHAVLVVKTSSGDLVLDNARHTIIKRHQTGYRWIAMASSDPSRWNRL